MATSLTRRTKSEERLFDAGVWKTDEAVSVSDRPMAGICCSPPLPSSLSPKTKYDVRCFSSSPDNSGGRRKKEASPIVKIAVSGVTELLRLFSSSKSSTPKWFMKMRPGHMNSILFGLCLSCRFDGVGDNQKEEFVVAGVDDVLDILKSDYKNAYFVTEMKLWKGNEALEGYFVMTYILETGIFTSEIYADDCLFEDPTIKFRGKELYSRNLKLLVPFFDCPSIQLQKINKGNKSGVEFVVAAWKLRTYLKLPWRPLITIHGSTLYELDEELKIVRHAESWSVSALEAIGQIFIPSFRGD
ncbi:uncharacterized protein LOC111012984 isoform X2 [Momordica charantia]|uniref:Uncharacterized protein LOC111012984 isoform X2 n=1 Tax=Momordica charantia TaxID=3673 RepID=A0A6J1CPG8_MOMCH|nr:uncharacterized protein LOC111012984 isoform X2 [Momordica charantia]